jgi:hypothetical protein
LSQKLALRNSRKGTSFTNKDIDFSGRGQVSSGGLGGCLKVDILVLGQAEERTGVAQNKGGDTGTKTGGPSDRGY